MSLLFQSLDGDRLQTLVQTNTLVHSHDPELLTYPQISVSFVSRAISLSCLMLLRNKMGAR